MRRRSAAIQRRGKYSREEVANAAVELRETTGEPTALAFAFVTSDYVPHLEEFSEIVRVDGHVIELVGATGAGVHGWRRGKRRRRRLRLARARSGARRF